MVKDEARLRAAMRDWLAACEALERAMGDGEAYAESLRLADTAGLARLRLQAELVAQGWTPPRTVTRERDDVS